MLDDQDTQNQKTSKCLMNINQINKQLDKKQMEPSTEKRDSKDVIDKFKNVISKLENKLNLLSSELKND